MDDNITLLNRISALHMVYQINKANVMWFSQLVSLKPGVMIHLKVNEISDRDKMVF